MVTIIWIWAVKAVAGLDVPRTASSLANLASTLARVYHLLGVI